MKFHPGQRVWFYSLSGAKPFAGVIIRKHPDWPKYLVQWDQGGKPSLVHEERLKTHQPPKGQVFA